ncbi:MAG TPA: AAA family ATPase, partial [Candidatus Choladousia intestinigallinarum]|nr:AAA family ATPase [Candidatus Choladousia intestinigallinarum]
MKWRPLPIGVDDFEKLIRESYYYVDKTLLIRDLLDMKGEVNLFTRPRRFGKSLNMSMLRCFFERRMSSGSADQGRSEILQLFQGMKILNAGDLYLSHMGQYPVISISLKSMKQPTFHLSMDMLKKEIGREFSRHWDTVSRTGRLTEAKQERYLRLRDVQGEETDYTDALSFLSECLYTCMDHSVIILIDEYDVPLENAYFSGFYQEMSSIIRSLFESALKSNRTLAFSVVTGCLCITRESIFTSLNNLEINSVISDLYAEHFGFTLEEVETMLKQYGLQKNSETVSLWYNGYRFGTVDVYNPWSVINYVKSCYRNKNAPPLPYWSNTSSNSIVRSLVERADLSVKQEIENLIEGKTITKPIHEDITYEDIESTQENLWNFLFFTGYLKKNRSWQESGILYMELSIPNLEVRYIYKTTVLRWFESKIEQKELSSLYESILNGNGEKAAELLSENLTETISFYDYQESYYHGFLAGMLKNMNNYIILSNR